MAKFIALFMGSGTPGARPDEATMAKGMAAWGAWMQDHAAQITDRGGPVGKTKKASRDGISDISNAVGGYVIVEADSHEAAAQMFEGHPHFMIFPGDRVEIMPVLAIPGE